MIISAIVAVSDNNIIGKDGHLPWHLSDDLKHFKNITSGHCVIMGRKNFEDIGKLLPNRHNIILTRQTEYKVESQDKTIANVCSTLDDALKIAELNGDDECFIIGGAQVYSEAMPKVQRLYLTRVHCRMYGTTEMPNIGEGWKIVSSEYHKADEKNDYDFTFFVMERNI